jgi:hypothetical protein
VGFTVGFTVGFAVGFAVGTAFVGVALFVVFVGLGFVFVGFEAFVGEALGLAALLSAFPELPSNGEPALGGL